jgi:hypothetical protein
MKKVKPFCIQQHFVLKSSFLSLSAVKDDDNDGYPEHAFYELEEATGPTANQFR